MEDFDQNNGKTTEVDRWTVWSDHSDDNLPYSVDRSLVHWSSHICTTTTAFVGFTTFRLLKLVPNAAGSGGTGAPLIAESEESAVSR